MTQVQSQQFWEQFKSSPLMAEWEKTTEADVLEIPGASRRGYRPSSKTIWGTPQGGGPKIGGTSACLLERTLYRIQRLPT